MSLWVSFLWWNSFQKPCHCLLSFAVWILRNWNFLFLRSRLSPWETSLALARVWPLVCLGGQHSNFRARVARVREGKHLLELQLWASLAPAEAQAKLYPADPEGPHPRFCWSSPILLALNCENGMMWRMLLSPLAAMGHEDCMAYALWARVAWAIYRKPIFPSVFWRGTKFPWSKLSLPKQTAPPKASNERDLVTILLE